MATNDNSTLPAGCGDLTGTVQNNGGPIDATTAGNYIKDYLSGVNDKGDHNYGYLFGLSKVTDFLAKITAYNTATPPPTTQIEGVRVYLGRKAPLVTGTPMEKIMDTLFMIPVFADGNDLPIVHFADAITIILGDPRPCPTLCSQLSSLL